MKKMQVTNDGKVFITAADSNISPRQYIEAEYAPKEKDLKAKLSVLFQDMLEGNIRAEGSFTKDIQNTLFTVRDYISRYAPEVSYDDDHAFGTNRYNEMNRLVSEMIGTPALLGEAAPFDVLAKKLKHFNAETIKIRNMRSFDRRQVQQRKIVPKGSKKYNILDTLNSYISPSITELIQSLDDKVIPDTKSD